MKKTAFVSLIVRMCTLCAVCAAAGHYLFACQCQQETVPSTQSEAAVVAERKASQAEYDGEYDSETCQTVYLYFPSTEAKFDALDRQSSR